LSVELPCVVPILRIFSVEKAREFHVDFRHDPFGNRLTFTEPTGK